MSTVADVSLAIIAATCIISVGGFIWFLVRISRAIGRAEASLTLINRALPGFIADIQEMVAKIDHEILGDIVRTFHRLSAVIGSGIEMLAQVQHTARRVAEDVILPPVATATGLFAMIREGLNWFRPGGDGKGSGARSGGRHEREG